MNILITGASKGLGFELVQKFAKDKGNNIVAIARDTEQLKKLQEICEENFQNKIHIYSIDFLSKNLSNDISEMLSKHDPHFDIVINNAGYLINKPFIDCSDNDIADVYKINLFAPMELTRQIVPALNKEQLCHFVNIGSMGGFQGSVKFTGLSIYSSSKAALANLTECLAEEYKAEKIKFNCLALGSVQTEMLNNAFPGFEAQVSAKEMASYIHNFSIQHPIYINGKVIPVSNSTP
jgi:short-subunit dehydrogenase